ncbi:MAG: KUP/HAK/KT family potassium transporter [Bacteroidetes bacterium]|nr:KUP/HAK/KT family potassium transporter [Bacteroidota bacterium]
MAHSRLDKVSAAGLLVTLGIIYGDIGTSPLYVMSEIAGQSPISEIMVLGGISAVFWTLTLQTTIKYVVLTLQADNKGEGGIFSLFSLLRRRYPYLIVGSMLGGAMLLADGIITPPISVAAAVEGLRLINPKIDTVPIVVGIIAVLFIIQRAGTNIVGKTFGPIMLIWFSMLAVLGINQIMDYPEILKAVNPKYMVEFLMGSKESFVLLGAVFLCTTGAEALYSDLGHCGKKNIRVSWVFVKTCLLLNYFGQGAWMIQRQGTVLGDLRPIFGIMPPWFLLFGIVIATAAAVIASQALISGSFTLASEAIRLHFFPKFTVKFPSNVKGQIYIPVINTSLMLGCIGVVLYFQESSRMGAAYGLAITVTMLMTSILLFYYLKSKGWNLLLVWSIMIVFFTVECTFLFANLAKFMHGGYVTMIIASIILLIMYVCYQGGRIKNRLVNSVRIQDFRDKLKALSNDTTLPKYATHLIYLSKVRADDQVEPIILYSILQKRPKRADFYWFVNVDVTDEPFTMEYKVNIIEKNDIIRVRLKLGFRVQQKISYYLKLVIEDMVRNGEINLDPYYHAFTDKNYIGDFRFVLIEEEISYENELPLYDEFLLNAYSNLKKLASSPDKWFGLDESMVSKELVPVVIKSQSKVKLTRIK